MRPLLVLSLALCAAVLLGASFAQPATAGTGGPAAAGEQCVGLPVSIGLLPLGDLTTTDQDGPYNIPAQQAAEVEGALAAKMGAPGGPFTDRDILAFLSQTECLEARFNTFAVFGADAPPSILGSGAGRVIGGRRAALTGLLQPFFEEVALDEQGHVRLVREVLGQRSVPCPTIDIDGAFGAFLDKALNRTTATPSASTGGQGQQGQRFDPYADDVSFLLSTFILEEIGATGDKGCILLASNPGVANCISGLAGGASYQSAIDRHLMWLRRNETVRPYGVSLWQAVQAVSDLRDELDGPQELDQGLYNLDPNSIQVPTDSINLVPTDIRGLTLSRTPQQVLRILTLGSSEGKGGFFPEGINGRINTTAGYNVSANARGGYRGNSVTVASLQSAGRSALVGANLTTVTPAPLATQLEASGRQYGAGFGTPSGTDYRAVYDNGTATSPSPSPSPSSSLSPSPAIDSTHSPSFAPTGVSFSSDLFGTAANTTATAANTTAATDRTGDGASGSAGGTTLAPVTGAFSDITTTGTQAETASGAAVPASAVGRRRLLAV